MKRISVKELIDRIYHSDEALINDLYYCSMDIVIGYIRKKNAKMQDDDVSDLYHFAFITFCEKVKNRTFVEADAQPTTYMIKTIRNKLSLNFRDRSKNLFLEDLEIEFDKDLKLAGYSGHNKEYEINREKRFDIFYKALDLLDDRCERIISAFHFEKLNMTEIADELKLKSADVAKVKKSKCTVKLKELVKKLQDGKLR